MQLNTWPQFDDDEIDAAVKVLQSAKVNYWTGEEGRLFEQEFASYCGTGHAVAVSNGSVGLDLALRALDVGPNDEVIVTPRSFFASASAIALLGATPVFADVDRNSQNITEATIKAVLSPRTKALICVHLNGWPCDMRAIQALASENGIVIIEDCAQAHGAKVGGLPVGSWGDVGVFSFCQDKIMSTGGEGGMVVTDDQDLWEKLWSFKDHGKSYAAVHNDKHPEGFRWLHESFGTNYRLTEMQAAIGRIQLKKLDGWVEKRRKNAGVIDQRLSELESIRTTIPEENYYHSYYKHYVFVRPEKLRSGWDRNRILRELSMQGIPGLSGSCPEIYMEKAFINSGLAQGKRLPAAKELGDTSIQLLVHPTLTEQDMHDMCAILAGVVMKAQNS